MRRDGCRILYGNFKGRSRGEIDVVCRDNETLVFVEVKTRTRGDFGRPISAVDQRKQRRISRGALNWLRMLDNPDILFRFDVVEVVIADGAKPRVELIKNAFPLSKPYLY
jgi:putative endonuclease